MGRNMSSGSRNSGRQDFISNFSKKVLGMYELSPKRQALKIACIYFLVGNLWILLSDKLVASLIRDTSMIFLASVIKGWIYVFITSLLIFLLVFSSIKKVIESKDRMNDELEKKVEEKTRIENELKQINERLERYQILSEKANDAMLFIDIEGNILEANDAALRIYGYTYEEFRKMNIFDLRHIDKSSYILDQMGRANEEGIIFETVHYLKDGTGIPVEVSSQGTFLGDKRVLISIVRDITERKKAQDEIVYLSYHDQLTGLYNRRFYEEELKRLDTARNLPMALVMVDVNGLKLTNDAFGHKEGDILLGKIANILKDGCSTDGIVARIGGDEFVILLPGTNEKEAEKIIHRINTAISGEKNETVILSASIGFAVKQDTSLGMDEVFKKAEDNMYRNKLSESSSFRSKTIELILNSMYENNNKEMIHNKRVSVICEAIAIKMDFEKDEVNQIRIAGLMHDIGMIGINNNILNKPGKLDADEWEEIKRHSEIGYKILNSANEFSEISKYVLEHHERCDGKGYPKGLKGDEISLAGKIIAVADSYDAMITDRIYKKTLSKEDAIDEIKRYAGIQFDSTIAKVFVEKVLGEVW